MRNFLTYDFWKYSYLTALLLLTACDRAKIPFQTELHVKVEMPKPTPTPTPEPIVEVTPTPEPTPEKTVIAKTKEAPKKVAQATPTNAPNALSTEQMQKDLDKQISVWTKRKVTPDELEAQIPEIKAFQLKAKANDNDATKAYQAAKKSLEDFKIDSTFISKKVERTLLLLNRSKLPPEKYTELQNRIEKLEKSINEEKYLLVNEELTTLQDEITDAAKLEDVFEKN